MKPIANRDVSRPYDMMGIISDTIQRVSSQARGTSITMESLLSEDLALDSLDLLAVILQLQDEFQVEIDPDEITALRSVSDLIGTLAKHIRAAA